MSGDVIGTDASSHREFVGGGSSVVRIAIDSAELTVSEENIFGAVVVVLKEGERVMPESSLIHRDDARAKRTKQLTAIVRFGFAPATTDDRDEAAISET